MNQFFIIQAYLLSQRDFLSPLKELLLNYDEYLVHDEADSPYGEHTHDNLTHPLQLCVLQYQPSEANHLSPDHFRRHDTHPGNPETDPHTGDDIRKNGGHDNLSDFVKTRGPEYRDHIDVNGVNSCH